MDVMGILALAGVFGGLAMAALLFWFKRPRSGSALDGGARQDGAADIINVAHIRVEGIGGAGMVLVAIAVALSIPQVGKSMAAGLLLGALMAVVLIRRRRAAGPMPSSGQRPGANTTLSIDAPDPVPATQTTDDPHDARLVAART